MLSIMYKLQRVSEMALVMFNVPHSVPCRYRPTSNRGGSARMFELSECRNGSELVVGAPVKSLQCSRVSKMAQMRAGDSRRSMLWYEDAAFCPPSSPRFWWAAAAATMMFNDV